MSRASLDKDPRAVASMFDGVARRYDITNTVLSAGRDRYWRRATRAALRVGPGDTAVFFPVDVHMPSLRPAAAAGTVRKTVVKVPVA